MEPSTIFAIVAGVIIIFGRIASRIAERSRNAVDDTIQNHDAQYTSDDEEGSPASQNPIELEETFAGSILAQILAEKSLEKRCDNEQASAYSQRLKPAESSSNADTKPKHKSTKPEKIKDQIRFSTPSSEDSHESNNTTNSEAIEDFDLRKAVIYSEILKPKFDE